MPPSSDGLPVSCGGRRNARRQGGALGGAVPRLLHAVGRMGIGERQVDAQRLIAAVAAQEVDRAEHVGPVAVAVERVVARAPAGP